MPAPPPHPPPGQPRAPCSVSNRIARRGVRVTPRPCTQISRPGKARSRRVDPRTAVRSRAAAVKMNVPGRWATRAAESLSINLFPIDRPACYDVLDPRLHRRAARTSPPVHDGRRLECTVDCDKQGCDAKILEWKRRHAMLWTSPRSTSGRNPSPPFPPTVRGGGE